MKISSNVLKPHVRIVDVNNIENSPFDISTMIELSHLNFNSEDKFLFDDSFVDLDTSKMKTYTEESRKLFSNCLCPSEAFNFAYTVQLFLFNMFHHLVSIETIYDTILKKGYVKWTTPTLLNQFIIDGHYLDLEYLKTLDIPDIDKVNSIDEFREKFGKEIIVSFDDTFIDNVINLYQGKNSYKSFSKTRLSSVFEISDCLDFNTPILCKVSGEVLYSIRGTRIVTLVGFNSNFALLVDSFSNANIRIPTYMLIKAMKAVDLPTCWKFNPTIKNRIKRIKNKNNK